MIYEIRQEIGSNIVGLMEKRNIYSQKGFIRNENILTILYFLSFKATINPPLIGIFTSATLNNTQNKTNLDIEKIRHRDSPHPKMKITKGYSSE